MADYNETLNLPQTEFPMRAGLPKREPGMLERTRGSPALLSTTALRSVTADCTWATP